MKLNSLRCPPQKPLHHQHGQALVYGLFVLMTGLASLFFLFNTGQLSREKTKLVNTADAVAYSAGVMHARALNYIAYTNRAMMANEVSIAQMVSLSSWSEYIVAHGLGTESLGCSTPFNEPGEDLIPVYYLTCMGLSLATESGVLSGINEFVQFTAPTVIRLAEDAKDGLQGAQLTMVGAMRIARQAVMDQVAQANYVNDGVVSVNLLPLDTFLAFEGRPIIAQYSGDERRRFADATVAAANMDPFVPSRNWSEKGLKPKCLSLEGNEITRSGGTNLVGYDEWRASDSAAYLKRSPGGFLGFDCDTNAMGMGSGSRSASTFGYSGIPSFYELSDRALAYTPENGDPQKTDPKIRFAIRLTRSADQTRTSDGTSQIQGTPRLNAYQGNPASGIYASVSASEVYFERASARTDGNRELASLFNPYWQVRLIDTSAQIRAAQLLQGVTLP